MKAYIVTGPESSGTRLMAQIVEAGGATRDDAMTSNEGRIVIHRSVPHGREMPDLAGMVNRLRGRGYNVQAVVMLREPNATAQSQVQAGHSDSLHTAKLKMRQAFSFIGEQFASCRCPFVVMTYESLVLRPAETQAYIAAEFGLETVPDVEIYDGNAKYYAD